MRSGKVKHSSALGLSLYIIPIILPNILFWISLITSLLFPYNSPIIPLKSAQMRYVYQMHASTESNGDQHMSYWSHNYLQGMESLCWHWSDRIQTFWRTQPYLSRGDRLIAQLMSLGQTWQPLKPLIILELFSFPVLPIIPKIIPE